MPGLEGVTLLGDYLEGALERAAERPGWAGVQPGIASARTNGARAHEHWRDEHVRADVMPATSEVERREEEAMESRLSERVEGG